MMVRVLVASAGRCPAGASEQGYSRRADGVAWGSGRAPFVPMMQTADLWDRDDDAIA